MFIASIIGLVRVYLFILREFCPGLITVTHALFTLTRAQYEETLTSLSEVFRYVNFNLRLKPFMNS